MFASALLVGTAHLRAGAVQRRVAVAVALFGALTLPLGLALPALPGGVAPNTPTTTAHRGRVDGRDRAVSAWRRPLFPCCR
jgi:hypothetical protein